jgi:DNA-binding NtrC family response regulator
MPNIDTSLAGTRRGAEPLDILIVSSRAEHLNALIRVLDAAACARVFAAFSLRQAAEAISCHSFAVVFCDDSLSNGSYRELLSLRTERNKPNLVLLLRSGEWLEYLEAMHYGAFDVLRCPLQPSEVKGVLLRVLVNQAAQRAALPDAKTSPAIALTVVPTIAPETVTGLTQEEFEELFRRVAQTQKSFDPPAPALPPKPVTKVWRDVA